MDFMADQLQSGRTIQNVIIETLDGRLWADRLNEHHFLLVSDAHDNLAGVRIAAGGGRTVCLAT